MGFESFRVELRGGTATYAEANAMLHQLRHTRSDPDAIPARGSTFYTVEDGLHVIEIEVADAPVRVSCRFTLCHPPSVDAALLALVRDLVTRLEMEARICDDVRPEHSHWYSAAQLDEFSDVFRRSAAARRAEWQENFGPTQFPAKTHQAFERYILPRCEPVAGHPR